MGQVDVIGTYQVLIELSYVSCVNLTFLSETVGVSSTGFLSIASIL